MAENLSGGENTFERTSVRLASAALYGIQECAGELFSDHPFGPAGAGNGNAVAGGVSF
jgi:hypothetical protein